MTGRRRGRHTAPVTRRAGAGRRAGTVEAVGRALRASDARRTVGSQRAAPVDDRGAVTAELTVGLIAVTAVLLAVLATGAATLTRLTCLDAARTAARVAALGEPDAEVVGAARNVRGERGGQVEVVRDDGWVTVVVRAPFTGWTGTGAMSARATATAWAEP